jgi:hypothetical protein
MRIYSDILTKEDLYRELGDMPDVLLEHCRPFSSRSTRYGYEVYLEGLGGRHKRHRNGREGKAATWDDYGVWMARLFAIDPNARIAHYNGYDQFIEYTSKNVPAGNYAPWLSEDVLTHA